MKTIQATKMHGMIWALFPNHFKYHCYVPDMDSPPKSDSSKRLYVSLCDRTYALRNEPPTELPIERVEEHEACKKCWLRWQQVQNWKGAA